jgi:MoxR-like ATPase
MKIKQGTIVRVEKSGNRFNAFDSNGKKYTGVITSTTRKHAHQNGNAIEYRSNGKWYQCDMSLYQKTENVNSVPMAEQVNVEVPSGHQEMMDFIQESYSLKPKDLVISELKWKYLIRSAVRGKNIMMTGPAGCGKTLAAKSLVNSLDRPNFYFNMGATQDPRATLIGNVHFEKSKGTYFSESLFVKAIQTPNAVILLDELTRAHPDAWNILMTVLDQGQRYLRLDEQDGQATINVAEGVCFVSTANIGNEYTATRQLDKALLDRFVIIEMDTLSDEQEHGLLQYMFPAVNSEELKKVSSIAFLTRSESKADNPRIGTGISTRTSVEIAGLLFDGFSIEEAADITIYPQYDADGGADSERTFVKQIVQKFMDDGSSDDLFDVDEEK